MDLLSAILAKQLSGGGGGFIEASKQASGGGTFPLKIDDIRRVMNGTPLILTNLEYEGNDLVPIERCVVFPLMVTDDTVENRPTQEVPMSCIILTSDRRVLTSCYCVVSYSLGGFEWGWVGLSASESIDESLYYFSDLPDDPVAFTPFIEDSTYLNTLNTALDTLCTTALSDGTANTWLDEAECQEVQNYFTYADGDVTKMPCLSLSTEGVSCTMSPVSLNDYYCKYVGASIVNVPLGDNQYKHYDAELNVLVGKYDAFLEVTMEEIASNER